MVSTGALVAMLAGCVEAGHDARAGQRRTRGGAAAAPVRAGCDGARLLVVPDDPAAPGPWPAGLRTVRLGDLVADVYYPARPGSDAGRSRATHDLRDFLPPRQAARLRDAELPEVPCACTRDRPLDRARGPYPVVLFLHGRGLTRAEFPSLCAHLASRGFVVIAPDLPGVSLAGYQRGDRAPDRERALAPLLDALERPSGDLAFLDGRLAGRLGLVGHSLGAGVVASLVDEHGEVAVVMGAAGVPRTGRDVSVLVLGGTSDGFTPFSMQVEGYDDSPSPRRLVGVRGAGHMHFADHCAVATDEGGWYAAAAAAGLRLRGFPALLADKGCIDGDLPPERTRRVILAAITAALEERLTCSSAATAALRDLREDPDVAVHREDLD